MASPNRSFVLASEGVWRHYHGRLREIRREWSVTHVSDDVDDDIEERLRISAVMREAARANLRAEVRSLVLQGFGGRYLIPV